jgi:hypothetical protein
VYLKIKKLAPLLILFLLLTFLISGCSSINENSEIMTKDESPFPLSQETLTINESGNLYPVFQTGVESLPETLEIPVTNSETGIVMGKLLSISNDNKPYINVWLFLGNQIASNEDIKDAPVLVSISPTSDFHASQALDGGFLFTDVIPGKYSLVLWTPMNTSLLRDEETNIYVSVEVKAGELVNLGSIHLP